MKQSKLYPAVVLGSICLAVALLLSTINMITAPIIADRESASANAALVEVLPDGKDFKELEITDAYPSVVKAGWTADGGCVFKVIVEGYKAALVIMVGISSDLKVAGTKVISSGDSDDQEKMVFPRFEGTAGEYAGKSLDGFEIITVSTATYTSTAYGKAVKAALQSAILAGGGDVDIRTPEQILQDNCNAALGTEGKTFKKWFATEILVGADKIYECDAGAVVLVGDKYIGISADGELKRSVDAAGEVSTPTEEDGAIATAAYELYVNSNPVEIAKPDGAKKSVLKAYKTASGNYVFDMRGAGNGINGEEWSHPSGEYIYLSVAISAEGKIIDVVTTAQSESKGYGDVCASDEYTEQFKGAEAGDIVETPEHGSIGSTDLGAISGSTITSNGYQRALKQAFEAFELLTASEGGNE